MRWRLCVGRSGATVLVQRAPAVAWRLHGEVRAACAHGAKWASGGGTNLDRYAVARTCATHDTWTGWRCGPEALPAAAATDGASQTRGVSCLSQWCTLVVAARARACPAQLTIRSAHV